MITYILRRKGSGKETCKGIVASMDKVKQIRHTRIHRYKSPDILIRWGCRADCDSKFEINSPEIIELVNHKVDSRKVLIEAEIPTPKTYFSKKEIYDGNPNFPLVGRKTRHSQGKNMVICENLVDVGVDKSSSYWSEFIPKDREFRVYTFFGKILGICEKIPKDKEQISWNNSLDNGEFITIPWKKWPLNVGLLALKASKVIGADFSAVDIISKGDDCYVLELNNAPTCSPYRQGLFARAFSWVINEITQSGEKPAHADLPKVVKTYKSMIHKCLFKKKDNEKDNEENKAA